MNCPKCGGDLELRDERSVGLPDEFWWCPKLCMYLQQRLIGVRRLRQKQIMEGDMMKKGDRVRIKSKYPATNGRIGTIEAMGDNQRNDRWIVQLSPSEFVVVYPEQLEVCDE